MNTGKVKFFNVTKGFGFIKDNESGEEEEALRTSLRPGRPCLFGYSTGLCGIFFKSFGHRGGDFGQLTNEGINLFAPFAVSAEAEPDDRWERLR